MSLNYDKIPSIIQKILPFIKYLKPYFKIHTLLLSSLIAGFIGAVTQSIILLIMPLSDSFDNINNMILFLALTFVVNALYGFIIKGINLFPYLKKNYDDKIDIIRTIYRDGISGLIIQLTLLLIILIKKII